MIVHASPAGKGVTYKKMIDIFIESIDFSVAELNSDPPDACSGGKIPKAPLEVAVGRSEEDDKKPVKLYKYLLKVLNKNNRTSFRKFLEPLPSATYYVIFVTFLKEIPHWFAGM